MGACASISMTHWLHAAISISVQSCSAWPSASNHGGGHEIRSLRRPPLGSFDRRSADGYRAVAGRAMDHPPQRKDLPRGEAWNSACAGGNIDGGGADGARLSRHPYSARLNPTKHSKNK